MIYAICNQKGGVAKTTTAAALAQAAVYRGKDALAIDLDPQGSLTVALGGKASENNSRKLLEGEPVNFLFQKTAQGVDLIPSSLDLAVMQTEKGSARRLSEGLARCMHAYTFIDTPTHAGELLYNALQACQYFIIPVEADAFGLQSIYQILYTARAFQKTNRDLKPAGVIITRYNGRTNYAQHMRGVIQEKAEALGVPYLGEVRPAIALEEAQGYQRSLFEYAPKSNPAIDYLRIFDQIH